MGHGQWRIEHPSLVLTVRRLCSWLRVGWRSVGATGVRPRCDRYRDCPPHCEEDTAQPARVSAGSKATVSLWLQYLLYRTWAWWAVVVSVAPISLMNQSDKEWCAQHTLGYFTVLPDLTPLLSNVFLRFWLCYYCFMNTNSECYPWCVICGINVNVMYACMCLCTYTCVSQEYSSQ